MSKWIVLLACTFSLAACGTMTEKPAGTSGAVESSGASSTGTGGTMPSQDTNPSAPTGRGLPNIPGNSK